MSSAPAPNVITLANARRQVLRAWRYRWTPTIVMVLAAFVLAGFSVWQYLHDQNDRRATTLRLDQYVFTTQQLSTSVEQLRAQVAARGETPVVPPVPAEVKAGQPGPVGPAGPEGKQGPAGKDGKDGRDGVSPTVFSVPTGDSRCPYGGSGIRDAAGATAVVCNGAPGKDGAQGPAGKDGAPGAAGAAGPQGAQGPQGPAGQNGTDGVQGPQGAAGATGPQGAQGPPGQDGVSPTVIYCQPPDLSGTQVCTTFPPGT